MVLNHGFDSWDLQVTSALRFKSVTVDIRCGAPVNVRKGGLFHKETHKRIYGRYITHRIGSMYAIYGNMDPINIPQMLAYIPAPWIRHGS